MSRIPKGRRAVTTSVTTNVPSDASGQSASADDVDALDAGGRI